MAPYKGDPKGPGGPDFTRFPEAAYFVDLEDISRPGMSPLLEVPMTVLVPEYSHASQLCTRLLRRAGKLGRRVASRFFPPIVKLVPISPHRYHLESLLAAALAQGRKHVEFMLHSSELMPGGSPWFSTPETIEVLYGGLESLFAYASMRFCGQTLHEYYDSFMRGQRTSSGLAPRHPLDTWAAEQER